MSQRWTFVLAVALVLAATGISFAQGADVPAEAAETVSEAAEEQVRIPGVWWVAPIGSLLALVFALKFFYEVKGANPGDEKMQEIAQHVTDGAYAYLRRQYKVVAVFFAVVCVVLFVMGQYGLQHWIVFFAFLTGGFFSGLCGFLGMKTATLASNRTAQGAKEGLNRGLIVAFRAGAVMGLVVVGFGLLDITLWFLVLTQIFPMMGMAMPLTEVTVVMLTFGMGASSQALFARVGGGIYTKAADVGADLVGKVEAGIPEDDPRNPATIADNVGDNVGDVAGMGADLYESYCGSILATAALGVAAATVLKVPEAAINFLAAPMVLAGVGILLSIVGIYMVRTREGATMKQLMGALGRGVNGSSILILVAALGVCYWLLGDIKRGGETVVCWYGVWGSIVSGLVAGVIIGKATEYYTSYDYKPTQDVAKASETGPATVIIAGLAKGMKSTWTALLTVIVAIVAAYSFAGGFDEMLLGLYGVGIAAVGMLATLGITLATDAYGPIADNAGGNAEMTGQPPEVRKRTDALDSLGNTTAAVGKGFAIGSAALTALALMAAYVEEVRIGQVREGKGAVVAMVEDAAKTAGAGVGVMTNIGYGKIGVKLHEGTKEEAFDCLMVLNVPKDVEIPEGKIAGTLGEPDEDAGVRALALGAAPAAGEEDKRPVLTVVTARNATLPQYMLFYDVTLMNPKVLCGIFAGVLLVFVFSAMTMEAVGRAAQAMVSEVRRQFGIMRDALRKQGVDDATLGNPEKWPEKIDADGEVYPDYASCVAISTAGAQREMIIPSLLALVVPVGVGLMLDVPGVLGLLAGGLACGFAMAIFMANAGGAWDNAKKYIEADIDKSLGGKGSENHKATVVGDTVGDPFKDTSGPSLNILIKLMSMVSVVFAGLIVKFAPQIGGLFGLGG